MSARFLMSAKPDSSDTLSQWVVGRVDNVSGSEMTKNHTKSSYVGCVLRNLAETHELLKITRAHRLLK